MTKSERTALILTLIFGASMIGFVVKEIQEFRNTPVIYPMYETTRVLDSTVKDVDEQLFYGKMWHRNQYTEVIFQVKLVKIVHRPEIVSFHTSQLVRKGDLVRIIRPVHFSGRGWTTYVEFDKIIKKAE